MDENKKNSNSQENNSLQDSNSCSQKNSSSKDNTPSSKKTSPSQQADPTQQKSSGINDPVLANTRKPAVPNETDPSQQKGSGINDPVLANTRKPAVPSENQYLVKCANCKQRVKPVNMMCPECKHYINEDTVTYQPVSKKTAQTIRWALGAIIIIVFVVLTALGVFNLDSCQNKNQLSPTPNPIHQTTPDSLHPQIPNPVPNPKTH